MPYTLKTQQIAVKDPDTGIYSGVDILTEQTTEGLLTEIIATGNEVKTDVAAQMATERSDFNSYVSGKETELNTYITTKNQEIATMIADADEDVSDLEDRKQDVADAVAGMLGKGVDNTLTTANVPAESKATGDLFETIVEGKTTQPTDKWNRLWIKPSANDYEIPTMDEFDDLKSAIKSVTDVVYERGISFVQETVVSGSVTYDYKINSGDTYIVTALGTGRTRLRIKKGDGTITDAVVDLRTGDITEYTALVDGYLNSFVDGTGTGFSIVNKMCVEYIVGINAKDIAENKNVITNVINGGAGIYYESDAAGTVPFSVVAGEKYVIRNFGSTSVNFSTRATESGSTIDGVFSVAPNNVYEFTASADANYIRFNGAVKFAFNNADGYYEKINDLEQKFSFIEDVNGIVSDELQFRQDTVSTGSTTYDYRIKSGDTYIVTALGTGRTRLRIKKGDGTITDAVVDLRTGDITEYTALVDGYLNSFVDGTGTGFSIERKNGVNYRVSALEAENEIQGEKISNIQTALSDELQFRQDTVSTGSTTYDYKVFSGRTYVITSLGTGRTHFRIKKVDGTLTDVIKYVENNETVEMTATADGYLNSYANATGTGFTIVDKEALEYNLKSNIGEIVYEIGYYNCAPNTKYIVALTPNNNSRCVLLNVLPGDKISFIGLGGGNAARLWATADKDGRYLRRADANTNVSTEATVTINPGESYFIFNAMVSNPYYCKRENIVKQTDNIIDKLNHIGKSGSVYYRDLFYGTVSSMGYYRGQGDDYSMFGENTTASEFYTAMNALAATAPSYITVTDLGESSLTGHDLYSYDLKPYHSLDMKPMPKIIIIAGQHGFEKTAVYALYYFMRDLISNNGKSELINYIRSHVEIIMIPLANPYGFNNGVRKNANGVDLNRNYDYHFEQIYESSSPYYQGPSAFSEPETQMIRDIVLNNLDALLFVDFHTDGGGLAPNYQTINWHNLSKQCVSDGYGKIFLNITCDHIANISARMPKDYSLPETVMQCGYYTYAEDASDGSISQSCCWAASRGIFALVFEGNNGFPNEQTTFSANAKKANSELIGNYLRSVLMILSKSSLWE